ncbi:hypothetical protein [Sinorhizobium meliloti]|uniref:hypothetical protein n=1 Tax=Rhizobium meliloti TaxID=382 RepID=UPI0012FD3602|nr:hypothetical protein [Sinorhizobium meliloti]
MTVIRFPRPTHAEWWRHLRPDRDGGHYHGNDRHNIAFALGFLAPDCSDPGKLAALLQGFGFSTINPHELRDAIAIRQERRHGT